LWETLESEGIPSAAVAWPATASADLWHGSVVDDRFSQPSASLLEDWPLPPRCISPVRLRNVLRELRVHPAELDAAALSVAPGHVIAASASVHAVATHIIEIENWQFLAVHYGTLLETGGESTAVLFDAMIGRLLELSGPDTDIIVAGSRGMLVAAGPGFASDALLHGARPVDIAATVLARFGLRQEDGVGRVFEGVRPGTLRTIRAPAMRGPDAVPDVVPPSPVAKRLIEAAGDEILFQQATAAMADGEYAAAAALLEQALKQQPDKLDICFLLGQCRFFLGDWQGCRSIGQTLASEWPERPWGAMLVGAAYMLGGDAAAATPYLQTASRLAAGDPSASVRLGAIALHVGRTREAEMHYAAAFHTETMAADAQAGFGLARLVQGDEAGAEAHLRASLGLRFHAPALHHQLGILFASQRRWEEASDALRTALTQSPGLAKAATLLRYVDENGTGR
jgi:Flp pilus assembly protein TadD